MLHLGRGYQNVGGMDEGGVMGMLGEAAVLEVIACMRHGDPLWLGKYQKRWGDVLWLEFPLGWKIYLGQSGSTV